MFVAVWWFLNQLPEIRSNSLLVNVEKTVECDLFFSIAMTNFFYVWFWSLDRGEMSRFENKFESLLDAAATVLLETGADVNTTDGTRRRNTLVVTAVILLAAERGDIECA